jgi:hypothetical protein
VSKQNGFPVRNDAIEEELTAFYDQLPQIDPEGHTGQIGNVLTALEKGIAPAITGEDGRRTIELITAIYKSGATRATAALPIEKDDPFYTVEGMLDNMPRFHEKTSALLGLGDENITVGSNYRQKARL